ncbi:MAG: hypothetical protein CL824_00130 [Crocinitomicaceae bacterium]|nr:hypothetical protein [Crocinitomicaceae bacterium]
MHNFKILIFLLLPSFYFGQVIDKIVAQVGDNIILLSDIQAQKLNLIQDGRELDENVDCFILEELLYQELLLNQAMLDSIEIKDDQVDAEMENRLRYLQNKMGSRQKLEEFYGKTTLQIKDEFRVQIKNQMLSQEMQRTITAEVSVTPKEVKSFYKNIPEDSIPFINMKLSFQQIVFYPEITPDDKKRSMDKLTEIRGAIVDGKKSFETMARIHSMDPGSAQQGGLISASKGMMVPQFESTVFNLKPGEVSDVFETDYGFHILKLISRLGDDYTCKHILIMPEFSNDAINEAALKMDTCYNLLNKNEITWNDAVVLYSNDSRTKQNKGIITNPITGEQTWDMKDLNEVDQQIYLLTDALEKGGISQPSLYSDIFERKQGIRIVRLLNRYEPHKANLNKDYSLIKRAAENDKKQRTIDNWIKSKISNAYVRIDQSYHNCSFRNNWLNYIH